MFAVAISMVIAVAIRSIISEIYLNHFLYSGLPIDAIVDIFMSLIFVVGTWFAGALWGFVFYLLAYAIMCVLFRKRIKELKEAVV